MKSVSWYLPEELLAALSERSKRSGVPKATLIRQGIEHVLAQPYLDKTTATVVDPKKDSRR